MKCPICKQGDYGAVIEQDSYVACCLSCGAKGPATSYIAIKSTIPQNKIVSVFSDLPASEETLVMRDTWSNIASEVDIYLQHHNCVYLEDPLI